MENDIIYIKMIREKILKFKKRLFSISDLTKEKFLLNIIKYGTYLILLTPLVFSKSFFPPPLPPTLFFRLVVDIILIAYIILSIFNPNYRPKFNILTIVISLFLGILILTSFTGINFEKSIWGNFDRMGGVITFIHLFGFFIVFGNVFKDRKDWERIFSFSILVGVLVVFLILFSSQFSIKGGGTLWNSSFLASYLVFNIYFALILFLTKKGIWQIFYGGSMAVLLPILFLSGCRGAIVSFCIGLFVLVLGYFIFFKRKFLKWFILGVFFVSILFSSILFFTQSSFVKNEFKIILENQSLQARFIVWQVSWEGWKERFLFGWGFENFDVVFLKYFNPKLAMTKYGGETFFDRAHNIILDTGVTSGIFGVLSYLTIFVTAIFILLKKCKESLNKEELILSWGIIVILVVYFLQNLLVLDTINSYMMFFLILAFINYILEEKRLKEFNGKKTTKKYIYSWFSGVLIIFVILMTYFGNIQPARASFYINKAMKVTLKESISFFQKSFRIYQMSQLDGSKYLYNKAIKSLSISNIDKEMIKKDFQIIEEELEKNIKKNPLDFYLHLQLASIYNNSFQLTRDGRKLVLAESVLKKAIVLSPKNPLGYRGLANNMFLQGKYKEQFDLLQRAIDLEPYLTDSYWYLAMAYKMTGEKELSWEEKEYMDNYFLAYNYKELIKDDPIKFLLDVKESLKRNPYDSVFLNQLFAIYIYLGEVDKARSLRESYFNFITEQQKTSWAIILQNVENKYKEIPE